MTAFEELGVLSELATALNDLDWTLPTDIQSEAIPAILGGGDVCMAAETGSGKTGAFCIPILQIVFESMQPSKPNRLGAVVEDNSWRMNIFDRDHNLGVDVSGLVCESNHPKLWSGTRAVRGVKGSGKYYYEALIESDGLCRMGWSTARANLNLGTDDQGWGFGGTGKKSHAGQFEDYGQSFTLGDIIGCFLDLESGRVHFSKNGADFPMAFALKQQQIQQGLFPAVVIKNARIRLNFGQSPLRFSPKGDWVALCRAVPACQIDSSVKGGQRIASAGGGVEGPQQRKPNAPMCLVVEPTKELAQQTHDQIERFRKYLEKPKIRNVLAISGISMGQQVAAINSGVDILTCTPGRIRGLVQEGQIALDQIRFFVLDEADSLLGGQSDSAQIVHELHSRIPKYSDDGNRLQMIVCSATLHNMAVKRLATQYMYFPQWIDLKGQDSVPETVHQAN
ncbi:ATP-dependent RNA helicase ddx1 [Globodera pallida]|nr:ATP-dependent RNA helicase ddx1 [Globodera pallida]